MEGVGARLGRSSSRYGTTTVFSGPVRKWKKDWVPITPSSNNNSNSNSNHNNHHQHHSSSSNSSALANGTNGSVSHLRLFKWTPLINSNNKVNSSSNNGNHVNNGDISNGDASPTKEESNQDDVVAEEPPRRKFKYIPIAVLEEQKKETEETSDDEAKHADTDENSAEQVAKSNSHDEKPDINDVPMEENQDSEENQTAPGQQDLNESLDLSLGLTSHEDGHNSDSKTDPSKDGD